MEPNLTPDLSSVPALLRKNVARYWAHFCQNRDETLATVLRHPIKEEIPRVWSCSKFVAEYCCRHRSTVLDLLDSIALARTETSYAEAIAEKVGEPADEGELMAALRRFRNQEMVRIAWRDLSGRADLRETMRDLSLLAESVIDHSTKILYRNLEVRFGTPQTTDNGRPQRLVVLAMGKLGARELNYSSDVDLIFIYPEAGRTQGGMQSITNQEFFNYLGKRLIKALNEVTDLGFVFRVDMRLRPFGDSGPLACNFSSLEQYLQVHGRNWERYAMIKARVISGEPEDEKQLMQMLSPFIYRRYLDFNALQAIRVMKRLVDNEVKRRRVQQDIKLGPGGIREIEFIGQTFQLIRGGITPELRVREILRVLEQLERLNLLPRHSVKELCAAYEFLRNTEHRLQQINDHQTQSLPTDPHDQARVALGMGACSWEDFLKVLNRHRRRVSNHFAHLLWDPNANGGEPQDGAGVIRLDNANRDEMTAQLAAAGYGYPAAACEVIAGLSKARAIKTLSGEARDRLDQLVPLMVSAIAGNGEAHVTLDRVCHIIEAIAQRSAYLALLSEHPVILSHLAKLCAASPWIAAQIARQPLLLDELLDPRALYNPPKAAELTALLQHQLRHINAEDTEQRMERLRQFKHTQVLRVAAADVMRILPLPEVSNHLSAIAEVILDAALKMAWEDLTRRYGVPAYGPERKVAGFSIVAYGKLGGLELGYNSDLDIIFLHNSHGENQVTNGRTRVANTVFFTRLAQRVIHYISTVTPAGRAYETDTRLRPSGNSGLLVSSIEAYRQYQAKGAWTWEHQALVRARVVAGDAGVGREFDSIREQALCAERDPQTLRAEVVHMRTRMRQELGDHRPEIFDLKHGRGGITDIEFMVQYIVLLNAIRYPQLTRYTDNLRLLEMSAELKLLPEAQCTELLKAYFAYRADMHRLALQQQAAIVSNETHTALRLKVLKLWGLLLDETEEE